MNFLIEPYNEMKIGYFKIKDFDDVMSTLEDNLSQI